MSEMLVNLDNATNPSDKYGPTPHTTVQWFGASTYCMKIGRFTIFLDTWLNRPKSVSQYLDISEVKECDYIVISHAHFDHLPGADVIAKATGSKIIANGEAINVMRKAGVPEDQLIPVSGGEWIDIGDGITIRPFPALHALPAWGGSVEHPEYMDTGCVYLGGHGVSTLDITRMMTKGFGGLRDMPEPPPNPVMASFREYMRDPANCYSFFDGGQMMYNFVLPSPTGPRAVLFSSHTGAYEGILRALDPKPEVAILGVAGRPNLNGQAFQGSIAEFVLKEVEWLGQPREVIWTLYDKAPIRPFWVEPKAATELVQQRTTTTVAELEHTTVHVLFE